MRIWIKVFREEHMTKNFIFENNYIVTRANYEKTVQQALNENDIGCPLQLSSHFKHFASYNIAKYLASEFVESCDFDYLTIENITIKK